MTESQEENHAFKLVNIGSKQSYESFYIDKTKAMGYIQTLHYNSLLILRRGYIPMSYRYYSASEKII